MTTKVDYTAMSDEDLRTELGQARTRGQRLRIDHAVSQLANPHELGANKKVIARILTEKRRRELSLQPQNPTPIDGN